jgi:hypothetical protein
MPDKCRDKIDHEHSDKVQQITKIERTFIRPPRLDSETIGLRPVDQSWWVSGPVTGATEPT